MVALRVLDVARRYENVILQLTSVEPFCKIIPVTCHTDYTLTNADFCHEDRKLKFYDTRL
jgi:hypothetical protein